MPMRRRLGRHEGAGLRQHGDQRVLAQEGRLAGHVGAGQQPQPPLGAELAIVGHEAVPPWPQQRRLDHGMTAAVDA